MLRAASATPVILDALDRDAVTDALTQVEPEVVVHEPTALAGNEFEFGLDPILDGLQRLLTVTDAACFDR